MRGSSDPTRLSTALASCGMSGSLSGGWTLGLPTEVADLGGPRARRAVYGDPAHRHTVVLETPGGPRDTWFRERPASPGRASAPSPGTPPPPGRALPDENSPDGGVGRAPVGAFMFVYWQDAIRIDPNRYQRAIPRESCTNTGVGSSFRRSIRTMRRLLLPGAKNQA